MKTKSTSVKNYEILNLEQFPNFSITGSISGMKKLYYGMNAMLVKCGKYIYNVDEKTYNSHLVN